MRGSISSAMSWFLASLVMLVLCVLMIMLNSCSMFAPSVRLQWGSVLYEAYGEHILDEVEVTKEVKPDGREIIHLKVKKSENKEAQANLAIIGLAAEAIKRVPIAP